MATTQRLAVPSFVSVALLGFIAIASDGYDLAVFGAALPDLLADPAWGLTPAEIGVIASATVMGMCVGSIAAGMLTDRFGARRLFLACVVWFSLSMILAASAPTPELLGVARFATGLGLGGLVPTAIALTMSVAPAHRKNFINGAMLSGLPIGGVVAALSALAFLERGGWRTVFLIGGIVPLLLVVPLGVAKLKKWAPDTSSSRSGKVTEPRPATLAVLLGGGGAKALIAFIAVTVCCQILNFALLTWLPQIMKSSGYSLGSSLAFLIIFSLGAVGGAMSGTWAADKVGARRVTIGGAALGALAIFALSIQLPQPVLYLALFLAGAGTVGIQPVVYGFAALYFPAAVRGSALGFIGGIGRLGGVFGPILGGLLAGLPAVINFSVFAGIAALVSLLSWALLKSGRPEKEDLPEKDAAVNAQI